MAIKQVNIKIVYAHSLRWVAHMTRVILTLVKSRPCRRGPIVCVSQSHFCRISPANTYYRKQIRKNKLFVQNKKQGPIT